MSTIPKWDESREATLVGIVGVDTSVEVVNSVVETAADTLTTTNRSISSKLRRMGYSVESSTKVRTKAFTDAQEAEIRTFVEANEGSYTYTEIAAAVLDGQYNAKSIQGKLLNMELTGHVKPSPKQEVAKKYTDDEEAVFIKMAKSGAFMEEIAAKLDREMNSVRGKALSLNRQHGISIPKQKESLAKVAANPLGDLGDAVSDMTVSEIADSIDKSERGVKTMLTHRAIDCKDYAGAKKAAKIAEKKEA